MNEIRTFAEKLKVLRIVANLSQVELARRTGLTATSISRYEAADPAMRRLPGLSARTVLAQALGVSEQELETPDVFAARLAQGRLARTAAHAGWEPAAVADTAIIAGAPRVGKGTTISNFTVLDAAYDEISLGCDCVVGDGAKLLTRATGKNGNVLTGPVRCGNKVSIGANAVLLPGTKLDDDAVVLPGSTVGLGALLEEPERNH